MSIPKWVRPDRQALLLKRFNQSGGFCIYGHSPCKGDWTDIQHRSCSHGVVCSQPNIGHLCRYKPDDPKQIIECKIYTHTKHLWHCAYSDHPCYTPFEAFYFQVETDLIKSWVNDDRSQRINERNAEIRREHITNFRIYPLHGKFSGVSQDIYFDNAPEFQIDGFGVSAVDLKPFVRIRLTSSETRIYVDLSDVVKPLSKHQKLKFKRYKHLGFDYQSRLIDACHKALKQYRQI